MMPKLRHLNGLGLRALTNGALRRLASMVIVLSVAACAPTSEMLYQTDWRHGLNSDLSVQANPGDLSIVPDRGSIKEYALKAKIRRSDDFSQVANGTPRAEVVFPSSVRFAQGETYRIRWSTMLPLGTQFDNKQFVIVTQIHQSTRYGSPPLALSIQGTQYGIALRGGELHDKASATQWICCADADVGRWVEWELLYRPDERGERSITDLYRDGKLVFRATGARNAYPGDQKAYLKLGLYKPDWLRKPTETSDMSMLYGPVTVTKH